MKPGLKMGLGIAAVIVVAAGGTTWFVCRCGTKPAPRAFLQRPAEYVIEIKEVEDLVEVAGPSVKKTFMKGLKERNWDLAASGLADDFQGRFPAPADGTAVPDDGLTLREYKGSGPATLDKPGFLSVLKSHLEGLSVVERTTWRMFEFLLATDRKSVFASVHFQVAGRKPDGGRADLAGTVEAVLVSDDLKTWKIRDLGWVEGWRAESSFEAFADITDLAGFHLNESEERRKVMQGMLNDRMDSTRGCLTVADFDRDGFPDVLASVAHNESIFFMNDGKGGFVQAPPPVTSPNESGYFWLYADLDGDGVEELVSSQVLSYEGGKAHGAVYRRSAGGWQLVPDALVWDVPPTERDHSVQWIVPEDVDRDGRLDLFFCVYGDRNSKGPRHNFIAAYDGSRNFLFMNKGALKFSEEAAARGLTSTQYTYVAQWFDFDGDGDVDLWEGNDYGPNPLWLNDGAGHFAQAKDSILSADSNYTMGVTVADWDNTGAWSMYISNMYSHAGNRIVPLVKGLNPEIRKVALVLAQGNQFYERDPKTNAWRETSVARGVNWGDWAWSSLFWDPDNDGDRDLFVANGFTSHANKDALDY
ncbi:MAG: VCBS repeat-containing protein [Planctomycetes bacterium]|nr:VCBS repeat-containing protein [Planctomycetota bacterium]